MKDEFPLIIYYAERYICAHPEPSPESLHHLGGLAL